MRAAVVTKPGIVELKSVPTPEPGPYEVLVDVVACGFCNGTDIKIVEGHWPGLDPMPYILGHEAVGKVVAMGAKVRYLSEGDMILQPRVEGFPEIGIATAWGGFVEMALATDWQAMQEDGVEITNPFLRAMQIVPTELDSAAAVMLITLKEVYSALQGFGIYPGVDIMIFGDGPVGICMAICAHQMGANRVILCGHHDARLALAKKNGITDVINTKNTDLTDFVKTEFPDGVPLIVDAIGNNDVVQQGLAFIADEGHIGIYGYTDQRQARLDWSKSPVRWSIDYLVVPKIDRFVAAQEPLVDWLLKKEIDLSEMVTHQLAMDDVCNAYPLVKSREALKLIVKME